MKIAHRLFARIFLHKPRQTAQTYLQQLSFLISAQAETMMHIDRQT